MKTSDFEFLFWQQSLCGMLSGKLDPVSGLRRYPALAGTELPPLGKRGGAVLLEVLSAVEMAFLVVVD